MPDGEMTIRGRDYDFHVDRTEKNLIDAFSDQVEFPYGITKALKRTKKPNESMMMYFFDKSALLTP